MKPLKPFKQPPIKPTVPVIHPSIKQPMPISPTKPPQHHDPIKKSISLPKLQPSRQPSFIKPLEAMRSTSTKFNRSRSVVSRGSLVISSQEVSRIVIRRETKDVMVNEDYSMNSPNRLNNRSKSKLIVGNEANGDNAVSKFIGGNVSRNGSILLKIADSPSILIPQYKSLLPQSKPLLAQPKQYNKISQHKSTSPVKPTKTITLKPIQPFLSLSPTKPQPQPNPIPSPQPHNYPQPSIHFPAITHIYQPLTNQQQPSPYSKLLPRLLSQPVTSSSEPIPKNIHIFRTVNRYGQCDINQLYKDNVLGGFGEIKDVWGQGMWRLEFWDNQQDYVYEYMGLKEHMSETNTQKDTNTTPLSFPSKAYHPQLHHYLPFLVTSHKYSPTLQFYTFVGHFLQTTEQQSSSQVVSFNETEMQLSRLQVCFQFQDPWLYVKRVNRAVRQREEKKALVRYLFLCENVESDGLEEKLSWKMLKGINHRIEKGMTVARCKGVTDNQLRLGLDDQHHLNKLLRNTNAKQLINHLISTGNLQPHPNQSQQQPSLQQSLITLPFPITLPTPPTPKPSPPLQLFSPIVIQLSSSNTTTQGNQLIKIHKQSFQSKKEQFGKRWMLGERWMCELMGEVKVKVRQIGLGGLGSSGQQQQQKLSNHNISTTITPLPLPIPSHPIPLQQLLTVYILNPIQHHLSQVINPTVILPIIAKYQATLDLYQEKKLFSETQQNEVPDERYRIGVRKWYEKEMRRSLDVVDRIVREEVKVWLRGNVIRVCNSNLSRMQNQAHKQHQAQTPLNPLYPKILIQLQLKPAPMPTNSSSLLRNRSQHYLNLSQRSNPSHHFPPSPTLSHFISLSLSINQVKQHFLLFFMQLYKKTNTSLYSVIKAVQNDRRLSTQSAQIISTSQRWLPIYQQKQQQLKYSIEQFIQQYINAVTQQQLLSESEEGEQENQSREINTSRMMHRARAKYLTPFFQLVRPIIQELMVPLVRWVAGVNRRLEGKVGGEGKGAKDKGSGHKAERMMSKQSEMIRGQISGQSSSGSDSQEQIKQLLKISDHSKQQHEPIQPHTSFHQQPLPSHSQPPTPYTTLLSILAHLRSPTSPLTMAQNSSIINSILHLIQTVKHGLNIQLQIKGLSLRHNDRHVGLENSIVAWSSKGIVDEVEELCQGVRDRGEIVEVIDQLLGEAIQGEITSRNNAGRGDSLMSYSKLAQYLLDVSQCQQTPIPIPIHISPAPLASRLHQTLTMQTLIAKQILIQKLTFQTNYLYSHLTTLQTHLSTLPKTVLELITKIQFIEQFKLSNCHNLTLIPSLQYLIQKCHDNLVKVPKDVVRKYYETTLKMHYIVEKLIPKKWAECMAKKDLVFREISNQMRELDQLYVEFDRNLNLLKESTLNTIHQVYKQEASDNLKHQDISQSIKQQPLEQPLKQSSIQTPSQSFPNPIPTLTLSPLYKSTFHNSISVNISQIYQQITILCQKITHKQNLFKQTFINNISSTSLGMTTTSRSLLSTSQTKSPCLPHSPQSLQPLYIHHYNLWQCLTTWQSLYAQLYLSPLSCITLSNPQQHLLKIIETLSLTRRHFINLLQQKINHDFISNNIHSSISIVIQQDTVTSKFSLKPLTASMTLPLQLEVFSQLTYKQATIIEFITQVMKKINWLIGEPLKLLKLLKKEGLTKGHLEKVNVRISGQLAELTLEQAVGKYNMLSEIKLIEAVSNDAWFSYHLQSTLQRIMNQLSRLKFQFIIKTQYIISNKNNAHNLTDPSHQILSITNFTLLNQQIQQILINLETIHKNPSKQQFETRLKTLHKDTLYISKCLQSLEQFQGKFLLIYPIFLSPQTLKQLPSTSQKFLKIQRPYLEILTFMKRMSSVLDSCNSQNIFEKVTVMGLKLEVVQSELATYLEMKRRVNQRLFFLSDNQMFELFACGGDIRKLAKIVGWVVSGVEDLGMGQQGTMIKSILYGGKQPIQLQLSKPLTIKQKNIQTWLSQLSKHLQHTILTSIQSLITTQTLTPKLLRKRPYATLITHPCPQTITVLQQLTFTYQLHSLTSAKQLDRLVQEYKAMIDGLVRVRRELGDVVRQSQSQGNSCPQLLQQSTLQTLIILHNYHLQLLQRLKHSHQAIFTPQQRSQSYLFNSIVHFLPKSQQQSLSTIHLKSFFTTFPYGMQFLSLSTKLIPTMLTQRTTLSYFLSLTNQQGISLYGPAATGKSQTTKDIAQLCGKASKIYNCSKDLEITSLQRIIKGMVSCGVWVCLDQFNLLSYEVMSLVADWMWQMFRYRAYGTPTPIVFSGDNLTLQPTFHLSITYNPNYSGRQPIPFTIKNLFRTIALVKLDLQKIITISFMVKGFSDNDLARRLVRVFGKAERQWPGGKYDFGLRTLLSVVELAMKLRQGEKQRMSKSYASYQYNRSSHSTHGQYSQQKALYDSIRTITLSRMTLVDQQIFTSFLNLQFATLSSNPKPQPTLTSPHLTTLSQLLSIRTGTIIYGPCLSPKHSLLTQFLTQQSNQLITTKTYPNILTSRQLFGEMNLALNIWSDGILTRDLKRVIRELALQENTKKRGVFVVDGLVHYAWMESMNTVLDDSRTMNLGSGESIAIPGNVKFLFVTQNIMSITPATISRNGIIFIAAQSKDKLFSSIFPQPFLSSLQPKLSKQLDFIKTLYFDLIQPQLSKGFRFKLDKEYVLYWVFTHVKKTIKHVTLQKFVLVFLIMFRGLIDEPSISTLVQQLKTYAPLKSRLSTRQHRTSKPPQQSKTQSPNAKTMLKSIFQNYHTEEDTQYEKLSYEIIDEQKLKIFHKEDEYSNFYKIFVQTQRFRQVQYLVNDLLNSRQQGDRVNEMVIVLGPASSGKSSIMGNIFGSRSSKAYLSFFTFEKICLTQTFPLQTLHQSIAQNLYKKSTHKLGALPGSRLIIQVQDLHLSPTSPQKSNLLRPNHELLGLILSQSQWYDLGTLELENIEDVMMVGDYRTGGWEINLASVVMKAAVPVFVGEVSQGQVKAIFATVVQAQVNNHAMMYGRHQQTFLSELKGVELKGIQKMIRKRLNSLYQEINSLFQKNTKRLLTKPTTKSSSFKLPKPITINQLDKIVTSLFQWNIKVQDGQDKDQRIKQQLETLLAYQMQRICSALFVSQEEHQQFSKVLAKVFSNIDQLQPFSQGYAPLMYLPEQAAYLNPSTSLFQPRSLELSTYLLSLEYIVEEYLALQQHQNSIVVFKQFALLVTKIVRTLSSKRSNILLQTLPSSGKTTLLKLCSFILNGHFFTYTHNFTQQQWLQHFTTATKHCFKQKTHTIFYIHPSYLTHPQLNQNVSQYLRTSFIKEAYTEADFEEMIYILQSFLIKNSLEVTRENCRYFFVEYLKGRFHLVVGVYEGRESMLKLLGDYPAYAKQCTMFRMAQWPQQALMLATVKSISDIPLTKLTTNPNLLVSMHQTCQSQTSTLPTPTLSGQYFQFLQTFNQQLTFSSQILTLRRQTFLQGLSIVQSTQNQIQATKNHIKHLQPTIMQLQKQTQRAVKAINLQKVSLEQFNRSLQEKNVQCNGIIEKSEVIKKELDVKNLEVNEKLDKIWQNIGLIKQSHIAQIKSLNNPSQFIKIVLTALVIIFYTGPIIRQKDQKTLTFQQNYFETAKKHVLNQDAQSIAQMLTGFDKDTITKEVVKKIEEKCMTHKKWHEKEARSANKAVYYFFVWVETIVKYFHIREDTEPMRKDLAQVNKLIEMKKKQVAQTTQEKQRVQAKINDLGSQLMAKQTKLAEYAGVVAGYKKIISRGEEILAEILQEKRKWGLYIKQIDEEMERLEGNCLIRSVFVVYASGYEFEVRQSISSKVQQLLKKSQVPYSVDKYWLSDSRLDQCFRLLQLQQNPFIKDNLTLMLKQRRKPITIIDPEEQGMRYLTSVNQLMGRVVVVRVNEKSEGLGKVVRECVEEKRLLVVEVVGGDSIEGQQTKATDNTTPSPNPNIIRTLLNQRHSQHLPSTLAQYESTQPPYQRFSYYLQLSQLGIPKKTLTQEPSSHTNKFTPLPPTFACYFYTRSHVISSIELQTKTHLINFTLTQGQLTTRIKKLLVSAQHPEIQLQLDEFTKFTTKSQLQLELIEQKLLELFVGSTAEMLINENQTIQVLTSSNKLFGQVTQKLQETQVKRTQLIKQQAKYEQRSRKLAKVYFAVKAFTVISKCCVFSFTWFERLLVKSTKNVLDAIVKDVKAALDGKWAKVVDCVVAMVWCGNLQWDRMLRSKDMKGVTLGQTELKALKQVSAVLQISQQSTLSLMKSIKSSQIPDVIQLFIQSPQLFKPLLTCQPSQLLQSLPSFFSQHPLFTKLLILQSLRPLHQHLTLLLLFTQANFQQFSSYSTLTFNPFSTHHKLQPILMIFANNILITQKQRHLEQMYRKNLTFISSQQKDKQLVHFQIKARNGRTNDMGSVKEQLREMLQLVKQANKWLVVHNAFICFDMVMWALLEYLEQLDLAKIDDFKVLVVVDRLEAEMVPEYFAKRCKKVYCSVERTLEDKIADAFFAVMQSNILSKFDDTQRNQRKYILSQVCILHYMLVQKTNYGQKLFSQPQITFNTSQINIIANLITSLFPSPQSIKSTLPQIITTLTHGPLLSSQYDITSLTSHTTDLMSTTFTQRSIFWQSLWAEDSFPKSKEEYKQYLKGQLQNARMFYDNVNVGVGEVLWGLVEVKGLGAKKEGRKMKVAEVFGVEGRFEKEVRVEVWGKVGEVWGKVKNSSRESYTLAEYNQHNPTKTTPQSLLSQLTTQTFLATTLQLMTHTVPPSPSPLFTFTLSQATTYLNCYTQLKQLLEHLNQNDTPLTEEEIIKKLNVKRGLGEYVGYLIKGMGQVVRVGQWVKGKGKVGDYVYDMQSCTNVNGLFVLLRSLVPGVQQKQHQHHKHHSSQSHHHTHVPHQPQLYLLPQQLILKLHSLTSKPNLIQTQLTSDSIQHQGLKIKLLMKVHNIKTQNCRIVPRVVENMVEVKSKEKAVVGSDRVEVAMFEMVQGQQQGEMQQSKLKVSFYFVSVSAGQTNIKQKPLSTIFQSMLIALLSGPTPKSLHNTAPTPYKFFTLPITQHPLHYCSQPTSTYNFIRTLFYTNPTDLYLDQKSKQIQLNNLAMTKRAHVFIKK